MKFDKEILDNKILYLNLQGDLIGENNGPALLEVANDAINKKINNCIIDISAIRFMNSSGIGVFITLLTKFRNVDGEVVLINPSAQVGKLLSLTKLNKIFSIFDSREEAAIFLNN